MRVVVDTRPGEDELYRLLKAEMGTECSVERATLDIGDVIVEHTTGHFALERKSWSDLCASLHDGRWSNQKARLLAERERRAEDESSPRFTFAYLIESRTPPEWNGQTRATKNMNAHAALIKSALRDNIPAIWTRDSEDAAKTVAYVARAAAKNGFDAGAKVAASKAGGYASFVKHTGKRKNADDDRFSVMLSSIEGVSARKAAAVAAKYGNAAALVRAFDTSDTPEKLLADVEVQGDARSARLGPALAARIHAAFFS